MKFEAIYSHFDNSEKWPSFVWRIKINSETFDYHTGLGHCTTIYNKQGTRNKKPDNSMIVSCPDAYKGFSLYTVYDNKVWAHIPIQKDVLECLFSDSAAGQESFNDFCDSMGYSNDSIEAFKTYQLCMEAGKKLRKALGPAYDQIKKETFDNNEA